MKVSTDWFSDARFGMFIHWGLYSIPAGIWKGKESDHPYSEWIQGSEQIPRAEYRELAEVFNPEQFNADEWIREARDAGMKYIIVTSKHHDGFALWPSKASSYNIADATPFDRDIIGDLAVACKKYGVKLGLYYSHWQDWEGTGGDICTVYLKNDEYQHPNDAEFESYWQNKCLAQVRELIENYDPDLLWFDSWHDYQGKGRDFTAPYITPERQDELISLVRELSDKCLVNSRINYNAPSERCDYISTMDNDFPDKGFDKAWETSGTFNESWAYSSTDFAWKPAKELLRHLISNASLGGNYQLNVGPTAQGCFQTAAIRRLREIGIWMDVNGESLSGTQASPLAAMPWGCITMRRLEDGATLLYLHLYKYTPGTALFLDGLLGDKASASLLETEQPTHVELGSQGVYVHVPEELSEGELPVVRLRIEGMRLRPSAKRRAEVVFNT